MRKMIYISWPLSNWPLSWTGSITNETNFENTP
jgi:hypothetical protein